MGTTIRPTLVWRSIVDDAESLLELQWNPPGSATDMDMDICSSMHDLKNKQWDIERTHEYN